MARNERLASALREAKLSTLRLASAVNVDPKTAERWVSQSRTPHPSTRHAVAELLDADPDTLWPDPDSADSGELVQIYQTRRAIPLGTWRTLMSATRARFDLHAFAATFLPDQTVDMAAELLQMAKRGVKVRLLLGDPDGAACARRSEEEGESGLSGRVSLVLTYIAPAIGHPGVEVRLHNDTLYNSLFRFDNDLLVNTHIMGSPAGNNPVLHLRDQPGAPLSASWQAGFERTWQRATPITSWPRRPAVTEVA